MTIDGDMDHRRAAKSAVRRRHLLQTARTLFVEKGFHQTGMAQIATASGIAVGQIYRDFANKEAIIAAICESDLAAWLEEDDLEAAVAAGDKRGIRDWIERIATKEPSGNDRRLMCEMLAEVGHNPIVAEISLNAGSRMRCSLEAALRSLAPEAPAANRKLMMDFINLVSWGTVAKMELAPDDSHDDLRGYVASLVRRELASLAE